MTFQFGEGRARAFVVIDDISEGVKGRMLTVFVPRWREHEAIFIPEDLIPEALRQGLKKGTILIASVNTEAERIEDLFFEDFEEVPPEDLTDEAS